MIRIGTLFLVTLTMTSMGFSETIHLVKNGKSNYIIYYDLNAPDFVKLAGEDLQRIIKESTGANLPIKHTPAFPMICLGDNRVSRKAGISSEKIPDECFNIQAKENNIYIIGKDTLDIDKPWGYGFRERGMHLRTKYVSRGTSFGVYTFLEKYVNVRWLLPGRWGEDIPQKKDIIISDLPLIGKPSFVMRSLFYVRNNRPDVRRWLLRLKTSENYVQAAHSWNDIPKEVLTEHPEYLALVGGKRVKPIGRNYKFCTTNPGIVKAYADFLIDRLKKNPDRKYASLSPTDGPHWCECEKCRSYDDTDINGPWGDFGGTRVSRTPRVLHFYNDVAKIVKTVYPDKILGGLIYAQYTYPPSQAIKLEDNISLRLAFHPGHVYSYNMYKKEYCDEFFRLVRYWTGACKNCSCSLYASSMKNYIGAPLPVCKPILATVFPALHKNGVKTFLFNGNDAWGTRGVRNYIGAKLMWDATLDIDELCKEWFLRAYGPGGVYIDKLYDLLEREWQKYVTPKQRIPGDLTSDMVLKIYVPHIKKIETLYQKARKRTQTGAQRKRLDLFADELKVFHWNLRNAGVIDNPEKSPFYLSDIDYEVFQKSLPDSLSTTKLIIAGGPPIKLWIPQKKKITIPSISADAPLIDGDLSDEAWNNSVTTTPFLLIAKNRSAGQKTISRLMYDEEALYISFECAMADATKIRNGCTVRDDTTIYSDDCVELFLGYFPAKNMYWHLTLNSINTQRDSLVKNDRYNFDWKSAAKITNNGWVAEIAIPFKNLKMKHPPVGKTWRFNLAREAKDPRENSTWSSVEQGFHDVECFGMIKFASQRRR